jgi:hypothetical protein
MGKEKMGLKDFWDAKVMGKRYNAPEAEKI